jgi:hypothetical protein
MGDDIGWMQPSIYHQGLMVGETPNIRRIGYEGSRCAVAATAIDSIVPVARFWRRGRNRRSGT